MRRLGHSTRLVSEYNYSTGCACAVAVTGPMAGTGPVAVPGVEAGAATDTGAKGSVWFHHFIEQLTSWLDPGALGGRCTLVSDEKSGPVDRELGRVLPSVSSGVVVPDNAVVSADFLKRQIGTYKTLQRPPLRVWGCLTTIRPLHRA